jgi:uncharacterized membrane protein YcaP (DUF421 family)
MMTELWEVLARVAMTWLVLLVLARLTGKKQLSQATFFDFITAIAVGDIAGENLVNPEKHLLPWLSATVLWFGLTILLDVLVLKNRTLATLVEGKPRVLIENGKILEANLKKDYLRIDELMSHLRKKGFFNPEEVEYAIFETDGSVSVQPRSQYRPVQPRDLTLSTRYEGLTQSVVLDGQINQKNLKRLGLTEDWLLGELARKGLSPDSVFYAGLDTEGKLFIDGYEHGQRTPNPGPEGLH